MGEIGAAGALTTGGYSEQQDSSVLTR